MPTERVGTLVIGGGQAGLAMSHHLKRRGLPHLVLERGRIGERWRSERWDGLKFQFPNWSVRLPDFPFPHDDPDGFADLSAIVDFIDAYAGFVAPPIRCGVNVTRLSRDGADASSRKHRMARSRPTMSSSPPVPINARCCRTCCATRRTCSRSMPAVTSIPEQLPDGAVLVVGAGASGAQIAEELHRAGRRVCLSVGQTARLPRRYRGHDLIWWFEQLGIFDKRPEERGPIRVYPAISGAYGGHTIDYRRFAGEGITLLGRVVAARGRMLDIAPGLGKSLAEADLYYATFLDMADAHARNRGLTLPEDPAARARLPDPSCVTEPVRRLDLRAESINAVIWATGYGVDFGWIDCPVFDRHGAPLQRGGVTALGGLYFLGLQWMSRMASSFMSGVGDDAAVLADHIAARS